MKKILIAAAMVFAVALSTHAGWWGATHGVDKNCLAMSRNLLDRVMQRCESSDRATCTANTNGMEQLISACEKIISRCPNGVSYHFWENGSWEINCFGG